VVSFTGVVTGVNKPYIPGSFYYDSNKTFTNFNGGTSLGTYVQSFTTASTTHFIKIDFLNDSPATSTITNIQFEQNTASTTFEAFIEPTISLNLTSLGIATLTKSQLDYLYQVWQFNQVNALVARQFIQEA
jgi:hypothetical protein